MRGHLALVLGALHTLLFSRGTALCCVVWRGGVLKFCISAWCFGVEGCIKERDINGRSWAWRRIYLRIFTSCAMVGDGGAYIKSYSIA